ncbi:hypothetical protein [Nostoc sp. PCC 9305]|uniref:hypothetical protein n=1 Tax=Nostoc sp. PCC 9305 TaxID=296636 RepID=UPI0039C6B378
MRAIAISVKELKLLSCQNKRRNLVQVKQLQYQLPVVLVCQKWLVSERSPV